MFFSVHVSFILFYFLMIIVSAFLIDLYRTKFLIDITQNW